MSNNIYLTKANLYQKKIDELNKDDQNTENFEYIKLARKKYKYLTKYELNGGVTEVKKTKDEKKFDEMINYIKCVNEKPVTVKRNYVIKGNLIKSNLNLSLLNRNVDLTDFSVDKNMNILLINKLVDNMNKIKKEVTKVDEVEDKSQTGGFEFINKIKSLSNSIVDKYDSHQKSKETLLKEQEELKLNIKNKLNSYFNVNNDDAITESLYVMYNYLLYNKEAKVVDFVYNNLDLEKTILCDNVVETEVGKNTPTKKVYYCLVYNDNEELSNSYDINDKDCLVVYF